MPSGLGTGQQSPSRGIDFRHRLMDETSWWLRRPAHVGSGSMKSVLFIGSGAPWLDGAGYLVRQRMLLRTVGSGIGPGVGVVRPSRVLVGRPAGLRAEGDFFATSFAKSRHLAFAIRLRLPLAGSAHDSRNRTCGGARGFPKVPAGRFRRRLFLPHRLRALRRGAGPPSAAAGCG